MLIRSVRAIAVKLPRDLSGATGTAGSPTPLAGTGAYRWSDIFPCLYSTMFETALVRIECDNGLVGWGEAQAPLAPEVACTIVERLLAPVLEGASFEGTVEEIGALWERMYATMRVRGHTGGFMLDAISGVDIALWDLAGKRAGLPLSRLLSDAPRLEVPAYLSGLPAARRVETARKALDEGWHELKLFYDTPRADDFFRAMDQMPDGFRIAVDALWRLDSQIAIQFGRELDSRSALWFEAPLPPEDAVAHGELARALRTPLALGESYRTRFEMAPFFREGAVGVFQPDLGRCGITEGMRLARQSASRGVPVAPHVSIAFGPQIAAALHFAAAAPGCERTEYNPDVLATANRFLRRPFRIQGTAYLVPDGPGLGIELTEIPAA